VFLKLRNILKEAEILLQNMAYGDTLSIYREITMPDG